MTVPPSCPNCASKYTYQDGHIFICPECSHEWAQDDKQTEDDSEIKAIDANGNVLKDGDSVALIKDLKVKGSSSVLKVGTKVKNIKIVEGDHNIDCTIKPVGAMKLKSEFVKKI